MDKAITTALLIVISMVMVLMLFNAAFPAINQGSSAIANMASRSEERMRSQIQVIHASGELSEGVFRDTNGNGVFEVFIWVKNVGSTRITGMEQTDVFFGPEGNFTRVRNDIPSSPVYPYWFGTLENAAEWVPSGTLRLTLRFSSALQAGRYFVKVTTPSGITDDYFFGM